MSESKTDQQADPKPKPEDKPSDPALEQYKAETDRLDKLHNIIAPYTANTYGESYGETPVKDGLNVFDDESLADLRQRAVRASFEAIERIASRS